MNFLKIIKNHSIKKRLGSIGKRSVLPLDFDYQSPERIYIGDDVSIGPKAKICAIRTYDKAKQSGFNPTIIIGNNVWCTGFLTIWCAGNVSIGNNTMIGQGCTIVDCNHGINALLEDYIHQQITISNVKIGIGCWIGANVIFLPSSGVGDHSIVGAGSVVTKCFPDYCMIAGNPARIIKVFNKEKKEWERYVCSK